jgi:signal transduction histidine kinase
MKTASTRYFAIIKSIPGAIAIALGVLIVHVGVLLFTPNSEPDLRTNLSNIINALTSCMAAALAIWVPHKLTANSHKQTAEAWRFLAAAFILYALGDIVFFVCDAILFIDPVPSLADVFYVSYYVTFIVGLYKWPRKPLQRSEQQRLILDFGLVACGSVMVFWVFIFLPTLAVRNANLMLLFLGFLYPALDMLLLWAATMLLIRQRYEPAQIPLLLVGLGMVLMGFADALFTYQTLKGILDGGSWADLLFSLSWVVTLSAAVLQVRQVSTDSTGAKSANPTSVGALFSQMSEHPIYSYLPYLWAWLAYTMLLVLHASTHPDAGQATPFNVVILGVGIIILLVTFRQIITSKENQRLSSGLTRLLEASRILSSPLELRPILNLILTELKHIVEFDNAAVLLVQNRDNALALRYEANGPLSTANDTAATLPLAPEHRAVLRSGRPIINNGKGVDETSWIGVPLIAQDKSIGLLSIQCYRANYYAQWHADIALAFANQAAAAIENARLRTREAEAATTAERRRLARELHDSVSQALFGIALGARTTQELLQRDPKRAIDTIDYMLKLTDGALAEMRALIFELRPESLATEGLLVALQKQTKALCTRHGIDAQFFFDCEEPPIPVETKEAIYRVALEATQNTIKHAHASHVEIRLGVRNRHLVLDVKDNGRGFDTNGSFPNHFGLISMRERASNLGGTVEIHSGPGAGTIVQMRVPLPNKIFASPQSPFSDGSMNGVRPTPTYGTPKVTPVETTAATATAATATAATATAPVPPAA